MIQFLEKCQFHIEDPDYYNYFCSEIDKVCTDKRKNRLLKLAANIVSKHIEDPSVSKSVRMVAAKAIATQIEKEILLYDNHAFTFDDERLQRIQEKIPLEKTLSNIFLFLLKEDIYYRARFLQLSQNLKKPQKTGSFADIFNSILSMNFELTEAEKLNLERFP